MINIAFYMTNSGIANVDCRNITNGNPGIGGTYYSMISLADSLSQNKDERFRFKMFAESIEYLPISLDSVQTNNLKELRNNLLKYKTNILIVNKIGSNTLDFRFFTAIENIEVKIIVWAHCFIPSKELSNYALNKQISKIVCVGREQLNTLIDHKAFSKSTFIYNGINSNHNNEILPYDERKNDVVYIGSLVPLKGFHILAKAWKKVLKEIPDARLFVIGGGNLYNRNAQLGKYGIAESFYEKKFIKHLLDNNRQIHNSVHFCGLMGVEKMDILRKAKVGIPNPGGKTETFGYSAIEMQLSGMMISTIKCPGYIDTVFDKNGMYDKTSQLSSAIITLLKKTDYSPVPTIKFIDSQFSFLKISKDWRNLINEIYFSKNNELKSNAIELNTQINNTYWKVKNRKLKKMLPFGDALPSLLVYEEFWGNLKYYFSKVVDFKATIEKIYYRLFKAKN
jgi:glycosyltransferase involved in cell wall biosynthesis